MMTPEEQIIAALRRYKAAKDAGSALVDQVMSGAITRAEFYRATDRTCAETVRAESALWAAWERLPAADTPAEAAGRLVT